MQIWESAAATAGGANRNAQGVQWGEREGECQTLHVPPPPPKAQGEDRDRTAKQSPRGLLQGNVCKPFSFRRQAGPQRPWGPGKRRRPLTGRRGREGGKVCLGPRLGKEGLCQTQHWGPECPSPAWPSLNFPAVAKAFFPASVCEELCTMHLFLTIEHVSSTTAPGPPPHPLREKAGLRGWNLSPSPEPAASRGEDEFFFNLKELYIYA